MNYVVYSPSTGEITSWGACDDPIFHASQGAVLENVIGTDATHHVTDGALEAYTAAQAAAKRAVPGYAASWSNTAMAWSDERPLADAQAAQIAALTASYAQAIQTPVVFTTAAGVTQTYQADPQSVSNAVSSMLGCQAALAVPAGFYWVAADNTQVPFTYADLQGLAAALFLQGNTLFAKLQTLKAQVRAATTTAAVDAVTW